MIWGGGGRVLENDPSSEWPSASESPETVAEVHELVAGDC